VRLVEFLFVCVHRARPPSNMIQLGSRYEVFHLKEVEDVG